MRSASILMSVLLIAVLAVSCGQEVEEVVLTDAPFVTSLAEAKAAAADGKPILLDFYTDT